jgi:hypothetical protein
MDTNSDKIVRLERYRFGFKPSRIGSLSGFHQPGCDKLVERDGKLGLARLHPI